MRSAHADTLAPRPPASPLHTLITNDWRFTTKVIGIEAFSIFTYNLFKKLHDCFLASDIIRRTKFGTLPTGIVLKLD